MSNIETGLILLLFFFPQVVFACNIEYDIIYYDQNTLWDKMSEYGMIALKSIKNTYE